MSILALLVVFTVVHLSHDVAAQMTRYEYLQLRNHLLNVEATRRIGGSLVLNNDEEQVNKILMYEKRKEIHDSLFNGKLFPAAISYFKSKPMIDNSKVFQLIQKMPKGGVLHVHDSAMFNLTWLIKAFTYRPDCYMCINEGKLKFHFFEKHLVNKNCNWRTVNAFRQEYKSNEEFDEMLIHRISIISKTPEKDYPTLNEVWRKFGHYFDQVRGLMHFAPIRKAMLQEALQQYHEDNVQYIEIRSSFSYTYEVDGSTHPRTWVIDTYREIVNQFVRDNPDFIGAKVINAVYRGKSEEKLLQLIKTAIQYKKTYGNFFAGFDVVGQEGRGKTLLHFLDEFLYPSQQMPPVNLPYMFHAGETDWGETQVDDNLIDAILLNTTRIGHGYALHRHPEILKIVKNKDIGIVVSPISNQVLGLVEDLRNHPASSLIADNYPIVISSDDPAAWSASPLSHDFYMAFMGLAGEDGDLALLKQLAINSIKYSAMTTPEKQVAYEVWLLNWDRFIQDILQTTFT